METVRFPGNNLLSVHNGKWATAAPDADAETAQLLNRMDYGAAGLYHLNHPRRDRVIAEWACENFNAELIHDDGEPSAYAI